MNTPHEPLLANLLGYSAGTLIFAIFLVLLRLDRAGQRLRTSRLSLAAAAMALIWNAGSLALLFTDSFALLVLTTCSLSLLPALLLDLLLDGRLRPIAWTGYLLSAISMVLHASEQWIPLPVTEMHRRTLAATAIGFAVLTAISAAFLLRKAPAARRAIPAMSLFLFALSFAHFHNEGSEHAWPAELAVHHAGIPLALFVLMQDYRFLLLDAFLRFLANMLLAGLFTWGAAEVAHRAGWVRYDQMPVRQIALMALGTCGALVAFSAARGAAQALLTRLVFRRGDPDQLLERLRKQPIASETAYQEWAQNEIARFMEAERLPEGPGRRAGGRPYLSEDLAILGRLEALTSERLEQYRESERKRLLSQAELRALQAQIHPHFLFNALNTLYGIIPKEAAGARQTVLNLSDIFRYFLRSERQTIALEQELEIVRAYLEIESLRLGPKLKIEFLIDPETKRAPIPVLSVQPLVENAVKHGIAPQSGGGTVRIRTRIEDGMLCVSIEDTGPGFIQTSQSGEGVGLENVRQRLQLRYGPVAKLEIKRETQETVVGFRVPLTW
ncbi:histidine kinase [uncultured Paludibaculum sp.]|uniref:histidine kinase n=1 Tax=uncultured Paludibaculum sp. TaxID=1765020 RepID=UPI002AAAB006|nr:histidine kinase [uncultured Paludibaculum sp.]